MENRIDRKFATLKAEGRAAFITFVSAGDPDLETSSPCYRSTENQHVGSSD